MWRVLLAHDTVAFICFPKFVEILQPWAIHNLRLIEDLSENYGCKAAYFSLDKPAARKNHSEIRVFQRRDKLPQDQSSGLPATVLASASAPLQTLSPTAFQPHKLGKDVHLKDRRSLEYYYCYY